MTAVELLKHEHQIILLVLGGAERQVQAFREGGRLNAKKIGRMADFFKVFVESCHNAKEEEYLFPKLTERGGMAARGQIAVLQQEHADGRELVQVIAAENQVFLGIEKSRVEMPVAAFPGHFLVIGLVAEQIY